MVTTVRSRSVLVVFLALAGIGGPAGTSMTAQTTPPGLLVAAAQRPSTARGSLPAIRTRSVGVRLEVLRQSRLTLDLFDDVRFVVARTAVSAPRADTLVWHGRIENVRGGVVTLVSVKGVLAGTIFVNGRLFEIGFTGGAHEVREMSPAAFPSDDPVHDLTPPSSGTGTVVSDGAGTTIMDVMAVWTPRARNSAGGTEAAIRSVIELAIANANTAYANSLVNARIRLVYAGEVSFTETTSDISGDLSRLTQSGDGALDSVHTLREQYKADLVSLIGSGYTSAGACGVGWLMGSPTTSFASSAFNVVDQSCAAGNLSLAHELGHNQGLHHDPAGAAGYGTPSYPYAYGYQDPGGAFRTVMSYGGAPRIPYFSSPSVTYVGRPTGTSSQDNARALNGTAATVAAFRQSTTEPAPSPTPTPTCTFSVTPSSLSFDAGGGLASVAVSSAAGCNWSTSSPSTWARLGTASGSGSASVLVTVDPNSGRNRSTSVSIAGQSVGISQRGPKVRGNGRN